MIIDSLRNAAQYHAVHPLFTAAFQYISEVAAGSVPDGKYPVAEGLSAILSTGMGKTKEASLAKFECHDRYIDIQVCLKGHETLGWKARVTCSVPNGGYNDEKDVRYFSDAPDTFFDLSEGQVAVFFPEDVHAPMIGEGEIKKLVIKVKIQQ